MLPAFARELDVRGNLVTMEDVFHLGLIVFDAEDLQRLVLQYTPCATDNIAWAMDPYVSAPNADADAALEQLDRYAARGGTELATLVPADERDIADAFAQAVTRVMDDIGTDPCCQPNHCRHNPEPSAP